MIFSLFIFTLFTAPAINSESNNSKALCLRKPNYFSQDRINPINLDSLEYESKTLHTKRNLNFDVPLIPRGPLRSKKVYLVKVRIGNNEQNSIYKLLVDTLSTFSWVRHISFKSSPTKKFDPKGSVKVSSLVITTNGFSGKVYKDEFTFDGSGKKLNHQFMVVTEVPNNPQFREIDGVLGMSMLLVKEWWESSIFDSIQGHEISQIIGLDLQRIEISTPNKCSYLKIRDFSSDTSPSIEVNTMEGTSARVDTSQIDTDQRGSIQQENKRHVISIEPHLFWTVPLNFIRIEGIKIEENREALIDTGKIGIYGPSLSVSKVYKEIPGFWQRIFDSEKFSDWEHHYLIQCGNEIDIEFNIGGVSYRVNREDLNIDNRKLEEGMSPPKKKQLRRLCVGSIIGVQVSNGEEVIDLPYWSLGTSFLKNVYTILDRVNNKVIFYSLFKEPPKRRRKRKHPNIN